MSLNNNFIRINLLSLLIMLILSTLTFNSNFNFVYADGDAGCYKQTSKPDPRGGTDAGNKEPSFIRLTTPSVAIDNYTKPRLELSSNSSSDVYFSYEKSLIATSPEVDVVSGLPSWLTISGNTNVVDLGDESLNFVKLTFTVAANTTPNSTAEVKFNLIDVGSQQVKATKTFRITIDRNLFALINVPRQGSLVRGHVPIFGLAYGNNFSSYTVEYGAGYEPTVWTPIVTSTTAQTKDTSPTELVSGIQTICGNLATFNTGLTEYVYGQDTTDLKGIYTVRMRVSNTSGQTVTDEAIVQVGRVMGTTYSGVAASPDGQVSLAIPDQSIKEPFFEVIGIEPISGDTVAIDTGYRLVGQMYEIRPAGLEFTKDTTFQFDYTEQQLGSGDETKLGIYAYNPTTSHWDAILSTTDAPNNKVTAIIRKITSSYAYYAVLEKTSVPNKPVLTQPTSPTQNKIISVTGTSDRSVSIEIFVNSVSKATGSSTNTGTFNIQNVVLASGENIITAKAKDQHNQISQESDPVTVEVVEPQITVSSLDFKTSDYSADFTGSVDIGSTLYIQLNGSDPNSAVQDKTSVYLTSSVTDPTGIEVQLTETGVSTGIYRGEAKVGITSSQAAATIAAYNNAEIITAKSIMDISKIDTVSFVDTTPPQAPSITSSNHPSVCQNTFEDGFSQWSNRNGEVGATLYLDNTQTADGTNCLELLNNHYGGNFASNVRTTPFDAKVYPIVSFDYKIAAGVKIDFLVKVNDYWYDIVFTDDAKQYWALNMKGIGQVQSVVADNNWHSASFNLYEMLKTLTTSTTVQELIMADWDEDGFMQLVYGKNTNGTKYYINNFRIIKQGFANSNPQFSVSVPGDPSGIAEYSYVLDQVPDTIPDTTGDGSNNVIGYSAVSDGIWYFHARAKDGAGNWGPANHYRIMVDTQAPVADSPMPAPNSSSGNPEITVHLTDNQGTGVDPESIKLVVDGVEYDTTSPALSYNKQTQVLSFSPSAVGIIWPDSHVAEVSLTQAKDYAGNSMASPLTWEWTLNYSLDVTAPTITNVISYRTWSLNDNIITVCWQATDPNGVADYSFILDQSPTTIPDTDGEGLVTSKSYSNLANGTWYFHLRAKDRPGNWSDAVHYQINFTENSVLVDNFDDGADPNSLGGVSGVWTSNGGLITDSYTDNPTVRYGSSGYSKQLTYDVSATSSEADWWTKLTNSPDMSGYTHLTIQLRGGVGGETFKIGLKDAASNEVKVAVGDYLPGGITTQYNRVTIPLSAFTGVNLSNLDSLNVSFNNASTTPSTGTIYVDEVMFVQTPGWHTVVVDLASADWKSAATNWQYTGTIANIDDVKQVAIGVFGYTTAGSVYIDNIRLTGSLLETTLWDDAEEMKDWVAGDSYSDATMLELSSGLVSQGDHSFKLNYAIKDYHKAFLQRRMVDENWTGKRYLIFDLYNPGDLTGVAVAVITNGGLFLWHESPVQGFAARPDAPVVNPIANLTNQSQITISGKAAANAEIIPVVETVGGGRIEQTHVFADANGNFSALVNLSGDGQKTVYLYTKDSTGVLSLNSSAQQVVILDQTPPAVPTVGAIDTPRREPVITVSGLAETGSTVHIKVIQPASGDVEYTVKAASGVYSKDITLIDGDGTYQVSAWAQDAAGNSSSQTSPLQVVLDAVNTPPTVALTSPNGGEVIESNAYDIQWQANDTDPTDTVAISLKYTDSINNQVLVDNFDDQSDINCLGGNRGLWTNNGGVISSSYTNDPILKYGLCESIGKWAAAYWYSDASSLNLSNEYVKQGRYAIKLNYNAPGYGKAFMEISDLNDDWSAKNALTFQIYNPSDAASVAVAVSTGSNWDWHESTQQTLTAGWNNVSISLTSSTWKSAASNWQYTGTIANLNDVKRLSIGVFGYTTTSSVYLDNILLDSTFTYLPKGHSLKLTYDVSSASSEADWWTKLTNSPDMSGYTHLSLQLRGASGGEVFKIGLKDASSNEVKVLVGDYLPGGITTQYNRVTIPLSAFTGVNLSNLDSLNVSFNNASTNPSTGTVYVDEVRFMKWQDIATQLANNSPYSWNTSNFNTSDRYVIKAIATDSRNAQAEAESKDYFSLLHNLAKNKTVQASSQQDQNTAAANAVDGDANTRWASASGSDPQWIYVDLGQQMTVRKVLLRWESAYATSYQIQVSDDAVTWTDVYSTTTGDGDLDEIEFNPVSTRYVRMLGTARATQWGYSLWEFEIY